jgi:hypothetical protein
MLMDRRTMLAGAAGLPLVPAALDTARPLPRRVFVFDREKGIAELVSAILERCFSVEADFVHTDPEAARSLVARHGDAYGTVFWRDELTMRRAKVWSPVRAGELVCPFSIRQLALEVEAVTGWSRNTDILRQ